MSLSLYNEQFILFGKLLYSINKSQGLHSNPIFRKISSDMAHQWLLQAQTRSEDDMFL